MGKKRKQIPLTSDLFWKAKGLSSLMSVAQRGVLSGKLKLRGKYYAITGGWKGATGTTELYAMEIVNEKFYDGELEPLYYSDHWAAVDRGDRKRSYRGMVASYGGHRWVFVGREIAFVEIPDVEQGTLF